MGTFHFLRTLSRRSQARIYNGIEASLARHIRFLTYLHIPNTLYFPCSGRNDRQRLNLSSDCFLALKFDEKIIFKELLRAVFRASLFENGDIELLLKISEYGGNLIVARPNRQMRKKNHTSIKRNRRSLTEMPITSLSISKNSILAGSSKPMHNNWHCSLFLFRG